MISIVQELQAKGAIERAPLPSRGYYSRLFLVPKTSGKWRPVIDLSNLNNYILKEKFKMETSRTVLLALKQGEWATSMDLSDAYFHVPIILKHRRYLRFCMMNQKGEILVYQFTSLPFGITTAPMVFTRLMNPIASLAHLRSIKVHQYLDDWLIHADSPQQTLDHTNYLLDICRDLGLLVNLEKSDLVPAQQITFLGMDIDLASARVVPTEKRGSKFTLLASKFLINTAPTAVNWQILLGHLSSLEKLVPRGRRYMRPLQWNLSKYWDQTTARKSCQIPILTETRLALEWWIDPKNLYRGNTLSPPPIDCLLYTDASMEGWGGHILDMEASGVWLETEVANSHINLLELWAVRNALRAFQSSLTGQCVCVMSDNTSVVSYINRQGGTRSQTLCTPTLELLDWTHQNNIQLSARHVPGRLNVVADFLSRRNQIIPSDWTLRQDIVDHLWLQWDRPHVDLFAIKGSQRLQVYVSPIPDPQALATDGLSVSWQGMLGYAFPPWILIRQVLNKIQMEETIIVLIAPLWPRQEWFPDLLALLIDDPIKLPSSPTLLRQHRSQVFHRNPEMVNLHAWRLSSNPSLRRDFLKRLLPELQTLSEQELAPSMTTNGQSSLLGVSGGKQIRSRPLYLR
jgi:hypothetical protein